jgi:hypothetical protein
MQQAAHRAERDGLRASHLATTKALRRDRTQNRPTGLAGFLGQVSGVNFVRERLHRHHDAQRLKVYREQKALLKTRQMEEQKVLDYRLKLQSREIERKTKALDKIDARELAAMERDVGRDDRVLARDQHGSMPSVEHLAGLEQKTFEEVAPDLMAAFERATGRREDDEREEGTASALDRARSPDVESPRPRRSKDIDRER